MYICYTETVYACKRLSRCSYHENGLDVRWNQTLQQMPSKVFDEKKENREAYLDAWIYVYNTSKINL